ncbi:hypothetical protein ANN_13652 [Periplaneta americana]|uniref:Ionotropic glutamate receptor L-glutamate and glycine-binding domain-containing protein n=1 Tax=Periplaneta americana TaxID=6978 RepID=A0ABQ8TK63_PERAM|nr:hypothetical protein ANN_13652 [Periplaneta americana]
MSPESSTESCPAFAHIGLRENPGKKPNQVIFPERESNPGHLLSRPDALAVTPRNCGHFSDEHGERWEEALELSKFLIARNIPVRTLNAMETDLSQPQFHNHLAFLLSDESTLVHHVRSYKIFVKLLMVLSKKVSGTVWLAFLRPGQTIEGLLAGAYVRLNVEFLLAQSMAWGVQLHEAYHVVQGSPLRVQVFGELRGQLFTASALSAFYRRGSLGGQVVKTASINRSSLVWVNEDKTIGGFYGRIWAEVEKHLNFTYVKMTEIILPATGMWGYKMENGTWTGVVGMVTRREAEVGVCDIAIKEDRVGVISYTMPVATFQCVI